MGALWATSGSHLVHPGGHLGGQNGAKDDQTGTKMDHFDIYERMLGQNDAKN